MRKSRLSLIAVVVLTLVSTLCGPTARAVDPTKNLPPQYRHWLNEEVNYIIQSSERKSFLSLKTSEERDKFIEEFWAIRNPEPGSETNRYKEEHYERLAYANDHFGNLEAHDGWATDMGRIWITLGKPKQRATYNERANVRPIEIWFYQPGNPALPNAFYVMFYKRAATNDWTIYSPYQDGPVRLVATLEAKNDQKSSLKILKNSLGDEVARTAISLLPSEPVKLDDYEPSMQSDVLLTTIYGLPDNPITQELLNLHRRHERVMTSIFTGEEDAELTGAVLRSAAGGYEVDYLLRLKSPDTTLAGQLENRQMGYNLTLRTDVFTKEGKAVYSQEQLMSAALNTAQELNAQQRCFAAEGRIPLAAGEYSVVATLRNNLTKTAARAQREFKVPGESDALRLSDLVVFTDQPPVPVHSALPPFTLAGMRFAPRGAQRVALQIGDPLRVVYQIWARPSAVVTGGIGAAASAAPRRMEISYLLARLQASSDSPIATSEEVDLNSADVKGTLVNGHTISTKGLEPGAYRLLVTAVDPETQQKSYASMAIELADKVPGVWSAYDAHLATAHSSAQDLYQRGLSAAALAREADATHYYQLALADDASYGPAFTHLVDAYAKQGRTKDLASLADGVTVSPEMDPETVLEMASAETTEGNSRSAITQLQAILHMQPPSEELWGALAKAYRQAGDNARAADAEREAARLRSVPAK